MSGLHWLATSERERQQALEIARALQQKESRDELGIGSVRDAIAELLFPGTSTLHTRARYFLFVPWSYQHAAEQRGSSSLHARVRAAEAQLISSLKKHDGDTAGLIGRDAGADLKRMPSTLYWQGLHVWNVRQLGGPQSAIERIMNRRSGPALTDDDGEALDPNGRHVWHPNLPSAPEAHPAGATFALTYDEADFLAERLLTEVRARTSALARLVGSSVDHRQVQNIWEHPAVGSFGAELRTLIDNGRRFSRLMHGAAWLYNMVLAQADGRADLELHYREQLAGWADAVEGSTDNLSDWDLGELWEATRHVVPSRTRGFVADWQAELRVAGPRGLVDRPSSHALVIARERVMKGPNARTINAKALAQWGGASGTSPLDFRWSTARLLLADIRSGLDLQHAQH